MLPTSETEVNHPPDHGREVSAHVVGKHVVREQEVARPAEDLLGRSKHKLRVSQSKQSLRAVLDGAPKSAAITKSVRYSTLEISVEYCPPIFRTG